MTKRVRYGLLMLLCANAYAQDTVPNLSHPNVQQVSPRVFALIGDMDVPNARNQGFISNSAFIVADDGVIVVDPGGSVQIGRMVLAEIRKRTAKPIRYVIDTHHHFDHWLGNQVFAELKPRPVIVGHRIMRATAEQQGASGVAALERLTAGASRGTRAVLPDREIEGDTELNVGNLRLVLYHPVHAHTQGDLAVYIPSERTAIAGDILFYQRTPGWQDASPSGNAAALQHLAQWDIAHVVPGHGPVADRSAIDWMSTYIALLRREVQRYVDAGLSDYEMTDKIDIGRYRTMSGFDTRFATNVNRMFLEVESESFDANTDTDAGGRKGN